MNLIVNNSVAKETFCVKGKKVFAVNTTENKLQLLFNCGLSNINQILIVPEGFIIKNTTGNIIKYSRNGKELWAITLGDDICTDDDCIYDSFTDKVYFFCYSHNTKAFWLHELDNQTGEQHKKKFSDLQNVENNEMHIYTLLTAEKDILCYTETINNIDANETISRVFQGKKIVWETSCILSGATRICGNKFYNYSFFDLDARQVIFFDRKGFSLPVYKVINFHNGNCLMITENSKNKLVFTDNLFSMQAEKMISSSDFFCVNDKLYLLQGEKVKHINEM